MAGNSNEPSHKPAADAKTEAVTELLRHLPYIEPSEDYNTQVASGTSAIDYREIGEYKVAEGKRFQFIPAGNEEFPPDVVVLTDEGQAHYGSLLLLDTKKGTATDYQPQAPRKKGVPDPETTPDIWRYSETLPVSDLLTLWEQKFRSLEWTANPFNVEGGIMLRHDRATDVHFAFSFDHVGRYIDGSVTLCRKFDRFVVITAGPTTSVARSVIKLYGNEIGPSGTDCRNLGITCTKSFVSLPARTMPRAVSIGRMTTTRKRRLRELVQIEVAILLECLITFTVCIAYTSLRTITYVLDPQEVYTFLRHHLRDPIATTINKEVEMTGVVPKDSATPRSIVIKHSSQIPSKTVCYPAARPGARLTPTITATSSPWKQT